MGSSGGFRALLPAHHPQPLRTVGAGTWAWGYSPSPGASQPLEGNRQQLTRSATASSVGQVIRGQEAHDPQRAAVGLPQTAVAFPQGSLKTRPPFGLRWQTAIFPPRIERTTGQGCRLPL